MVEIYITQLALDDDQRIVELLSRNRRVDHYWNIKNSDGDDPMMYCLKNNKIEMARCLGYWYLYGQNLKK